VDLLENTLLFILCLLILKDITLIYLFKYHFKNSPKSGTKPFISIIVAARNEAGNIKDCIRSLLNQDYPRDKIEILVGNDGSSDDTLNILKTISTGNPRVKIIDIVDVVLKLPGKMNVLAQLCDLARGKHLLLTDGDTTVTETWTSSMVAVLEADYGVVTGTTVLKGNAIFDYLQNIDWGIAIASLKAVGDNGIHVTSMGNNMGVSIRAYNATGGFKGIPYSITEDYELYSAIVKLGFKSFHNYDKEVMAFSVPIKSIKELIIQRDRWLRGVFRLHFVMVFILVLDSLFIPVVILLVLYHPYLGLSLGIFRIFLAWLFLSSAFSRLNKSVSLFLMFPFVFYHGFINLVSLIYHLIPGKVHWKGRSYD